MSRRTWLTFLAIIALNYVAMRLLFPSPDAAITVPYTAFKAQVAKRNVEAIYSKGAASRPLPRGRHLAAARQGGAQSPEASRVPRFLRPSEPRSATTFVTSCRPSWIPDSSSSLSITGRDQRDPDPAGQRLVDLGLRLRPAALLIAFYVWMFRRASRQGGPLGGALMGIGKSKARRYDQEAQARVSFEDVAGIDEAENELVEIVDFLKDPAKYTRLGGTAPKGVLLVGAPGTGKTLLAKAVAGEAGVPFFSMSAAEFVEMIVGVARRAGAISSRRRARTHQHLFIDIDRRRARGRWRSADPRAEQTLTDPHEMDGVSDARA